jgi:histidinol-phosphate aminotransferase
VEEVNEMIRELVHQRNWLESALQQLPVVLHIYPSDANFLLVKVVDARGLYEYLLSRQIVVRDRSKVHLCEGCLRITVGTEKENQELIHALQEFIIE